MKVLYLEGDPHALRYVSGSLTRLAIVHQVVHASAPLPTRLSGYEVVVVSNTPRQRLRALEPLLVQGLREHGLGLLMVGGHRSFGRGGYAGSLLAPLLPIEMDEGDDRVARPGGMLLEPAGEHWILRGLDWSEGVLICGHNRLHLKSGGHPVLCGRPIIRSRDAVRLADERIPLLALAYDTAPATGRIATLALDLAPPWSGGLTTWGPRTYPLEEGEVGESYLNLVANLLRWLAGEQTVQQERPGWESLEKFPPPLETTPAVQCDVGDACRGGRTMLPSPDDLAASTDGAPPHDPDRLRGPITLRGGPRSS